MSYDFFKELTGKTYQEYAHYLSESRRLLLDNIFNLKKEGEISEELYGKIIKGVGEHLCDNFEILLKTPSDMGGLLDTMVSENDIFIPVKDRPQTIKITSIDELKDALKEGKTYSFEVEFFSENREEVMNVIDKHILSKATQSPQ